MGNSADDKLIPEKGALSSSFEFGEIRYAYVLNISNVTVSLEVIPISSRDDLKDDTKLGSVDVKECPFIAFG